jgi:hypothetical protein
MNAMSDLMDAPPRHVFTAGWYGRAVRGVGLSGAGTRGAHGHPLARAASAPGRGPHCRPGHAFGLSIVTGLVGTGIAFLLR